MAGLSVDNDLRTPWLRKHLLDSPLQLQHHRTGGIDDVDAVGQRGGVSLRRFAVGTQKHFGIAERAKRLVVNGFQPHSPQAFTLTAVVNDVAEAIKALAMCQLFLGLTDGRGHAEAETTAVIYFYLHGLFQFIIYNV